MKEEKEMLLMQIEGSAVWRASKAHEFPQDAERNNKAVELLNQLHVFVSGLSEDHPVFTGYYFNPDEQSCEWFNNELRMYGFQNTSETPKVFIDKINRELIIQGLVKDVSDREN